MFYGISVQIFGLILPFLSNRRLRVVLDGKPSQEHPVNAQDFILDPTRFPLYLNDLPFDFICNITLQADHTTLFSKCDQASDLWQQLELAAKLESDLQDTLYWSRKYLDDFFAGQIHLVPFDHSNNTDAIGVKMHECILEKKSSFKILEFSFSSKLDGALILSLLLKLPTRKLEPLFVL